MKALLSIVLLISGFFTITLQASPSKELSLSVKTGYETDPPSIHFLLDEPLEGNQQVVIHKKLPDEDNWYLLWTSADIDQTPFTDENVEIGLNYEYRLRKIEGGSIISWVYLQAGIEIPPVFNRGTVLLVAEDSIAIKLPDAIEKYRYDLAGDGYAVHKITVSANDEVTDVKSAILNRYSATDNTLNYVILIGNVPVPYSGDLYPDGHPGHRGAWPADVYYADIEGTWTDHSVNITSASREANHNVPGDGKFDQSTIPGTAALRIGRIDLSDMPAFPFSEDTLVLHYLERNHTYRHGNMEVRNLALIDDNFADHVPQAGGVAWRNFDVLAGRENITEGDYFSGLDGENYLFSYGSGPGTYTRATGVGNTEDFANYEPNTVFTFLFGSYFGDWDNENNFLRAPLASGGNALATAWVGWPAWTFHPMGMGSTIGECLQSTQNNVFTYNPVYQDPIQRGIFLSLHGDPTLRMHTFPGPDNLQATFDPGESAVNLTWDVSNDPEITGYHILRGHSIEAPFEVITDVPVSSSEYTDSVPVNGNVLYQVRAVKLQETYTGSYYNLSQGSIDSTNVIGVQLRDGQKKPEVRLNIYPNPATDVLNIRTNMSGINPATISLIDLSGKKVRSWDDTELSHDRPAKLNLSGIEGGFYIIRVHTQSITLHQNVRISTGM